MDFNIKLKGINEILGKIEAKKIPRIASWSLNRTIKSARSETSQIIREKYKIRKADLDPKLRVDMASTTNLKARLNISGRPISLTHFPFTAIRGKSKIISKRLGKFVKKQIKRAPYVGVRVEIIRGKKTLLRRAFYIPEKKQIFERIGKERLPIRAKKVIAYSSMINQPSNKTRLIEHIQKQWRQNFLYAFQKNLGPS